MSGDEVPLEPELTAILAEDHAVVRAGLSRLLGDEGIVVVAETASAGDTVSAVRGHRPTVLILDLHLRDGSALGRIEEMREASPETAIVVLMMQSDPAFARAAFNAGALGYVLKEADDQDLLEAIRRAARGERWLSPELGARIAADPSGPPDELTPRELEVLRLLALGHTNPEIATLLSVSVRTVESHRAHVQSKTGRSSRAELVRYALENGLLETS